MKKRILAFFLCGLLLSGCRPVGESMTAEQFSQNEQTEQSNAAEREEIHLSGRKITIKTDRNTFRDAEQLLYVLNAVKAITNNHYILINGKIFSNYDSLFSDHDLYLNNEKIQFPLTLTAYIKENAEAVQNKLKDVLNSFRDDVVFQFELGEKENWNGEIKSIPAVSKSETLITIQPADDKLDLFTQDILSVLNELLLGGAEKISFMDKDIKDIPFYELGDVYHGQTVVFKAIGNKENLRKQIENSRVYRSLQAFGYHIEIS